MCVGGFSPGTSGRIAQGLLFVNITAVKKRKKKKKKEQRDEEPRNHDDGVV